MTGDRYRVICTSTETEACPRPGWVLVLRLYHVLVGMNTNTRTSILRSILPLRVIQYQVRDAVYTHPTTIDTLAIILIVTWYE